MTCTLAIVVNANAHGGAVMGRPLSQLRAECGHSERLFISRTFSDTETIAQALIGLGLPPLALVGGDGTLMRTLSAIYAQTGGRLPPQLVLLRGGTMNTIADGMGVPRGRPHMLLRRYRRYRRRPRRSRRYHTLIVDGHVGFLLSTGLMHAFLEAYYTQPLGTGAIGATALLARSVGSALVQGALARKLSAGVDATLTVDGEPQPRADYLFVGAGTVPQVGLAFRPYARVQNGEAGFHLLGYRGRVGQLARALPAFARGAGAGVPHTLDGLATTATIDTGGAVPYALDGELLRSEGPIRIETGPALEILP